MDEFLKIITHARRFKSATKELSIGQLEEVKSKLENIIEARLAEEEAQLQKNAEKLDKIKKYRDMIAADGIDLGDLVAENSDKGGKRSSRPPKYEIYNEKGERITWTGQGRMPNILKARVDAGEPLDTFLITK